MDGAIQVCRPDSAEGVREAIAGAMTQGRPLEIRAGGTKSAIGAGQSTPLLLDLSRLSGILDYQPAELVLTARAGTPIAEIEAALSAHRQMLAFEPMDHGPLLKQPGNQTTIGGVLAANACGPRRLKDGAARDHFLGFEAVSGRGELFKAGGKVVKNVTGYDLPKLLAGSWGTLAALTEVTIKIMPRASTAMTLVIAGLADDKAMRAMSIAAGAPVEISGAAHLPAWAAVKSAASALSTMGAAATLLRLEGFGPSVSARCELLRGRLQEFGPLRVLGAEETAALWTYVRDVGPMQDDDRIVWRLSVPPMSGAAAAAAIAAQLEARCFYDWAGGLVWISIGNSTDGGAEIVQESARAAGGHAMLIRAPRAVRMRETIYASQSPAMHALARRVKESFDPAGILNPGRLVT